MAQTRKPISQQARQLRNKLVGRLAISWIAYTVIFILIALFLNATLVPSVAEKIANSTSSWIEFDMDDYTLEESLDAIDGILLGVGEPETIQDSLEDETADAAADEANGASVGDTKVKDVDGGALAVVEGEGNSQSTGSDLSLSELAEKWVVADTAAGFSMSILDPNIIQVEYPDLAERPLFVMTEKDYPGWTTLRDLQRAAIQADNPSIFDNHSMDLQSMVSDSTYYVRDLSIYNQIRDLKIPVALILYLAGCIVLVLLGYRRSLQYFDDLSSAVGSVITNREEAIELPKELSITQNELNTLRLSALADERAAVAAERRKDELVAYLAHDVKTPLTSVIGYLMLLEEAPDLPAETRQRYIHAASDRSQRLETLIDEFFEITRYNLQAIPIEREDLNVKLFLDQIADEFYPDAHAREISIEVSASEQDRFFVDGDKLARAVGNVVRNAIAYANTGSVVKISATRKAKSEESDRDESPRGDDLRGNNSKRASKVEGEESSTPVTEVIRIENQGREISEAHLESIFEKFFREDASRGSSSGRSGLGLAIAKEIVVAHAGSISAISKNGVTVFTIEVPCS